MNKLILCCTTLILSSMLTGCNNWREEKSYEYYALHPEELYYDYHYCEQHPSAGACINIVKKYFQYQKNFKYGNSKVSSKGTIFRDLDQPINSLETTTISSFEKTNSS